MKPQTPTLDDLLSQRAWVRSLARALAVDDHDADDAEQETWLRALATPPAGRGSVRGWFGEVLRSRVADQGRARYREDERIGRLAAETSIAGASPRRRAPAIPGEEAERHETFVLLARALGELEEPYSTTIWLRFMEGHTARSISELTGDPVPTVESRIRRGLERLRTKLEGRLGDDWRRRCAALALPSGTLGVSLGTAAVVALVVIVGLGGAYWWQRSSELRPAPRSDSPTSLVDASEASPEADRQAPKAAEQLSPKRTVVPESDDSAPRAATDSELASALHEYTFEYLDLEGNPLVVDRVFSRLVSGKFESPLTPIDSATHSNKMSIGPSNGVLVRVHFADGSCPEFGPVYLDPDSDRVIQVRVPGPEVVRVDIKFRVGKRVAFVERSKARLEDLDGTSRTALDMRNTVPMPYTGSDRIERVSFDLATEGPYRLFVEDPRFEPIEGLVLEAGGVEVQLSPAHDVEVRCLSEPGGELLDRQLVFVGESQNARSRIRVPLGAAATPRIRLEARPYQVLASAPDTPPFLTRIDLGADPTSIGSSLDVIRPRPVHVTGVVRRPDGRPVEGARVMAALPAVYGDSDAKPILKRGQKGYASRADRRHAVAHVATDVNGVFEFPALMAEEAVFVAFDRAGVKGVSQRAPIATDGRGIVLTLPEEGELRFVGLPDDAQVHLRAKRSKVGKHVSATRLGDEELRTFELTARSPSVRLDPGSWKLELARREKAHSSQLTLELGETRVEGGQLRELGVEELFAPRGGSLNVRVTGAAVEGIPVRVTGHHAAGLRMTANTDSSGLARFRSAAVGTWSIEVEFAECGLLTTVPHLVDVVHGKRSTEVEMNVPKRPPGKVRVDLSRFLHRRGAALCLCRIAPAAQGIYRTGMERDHVATFEDVSPGSYVLSALSVDQAWIALYPRQIEVGAGGIVELDWRPILARRSPTFTDASGRQLKQEGVLELWPEMLTEEQADFGFQWPLRWNKLILSPGRWKARRVGSRDPWVSFDWPAFEPIALSETSR